VSAHIKVAPAPALTCQGDSGGPLLLERGGVTSVAGLTSYGDPGCTDHAFFTRLDIVPLQPYLDRAARVPSPPVARANTGTCDTCATLQQCSPGLDLRCARGPAGVNQFACGLTGLPAGTFGQSCSKNDECGGDACLAVASGEGRACFCYRPCSSADRCDAVHSPLPALADHTCDGSLSARGCNAAPRARSSASFVAILLVTAVLILRNRYLFGMQRRRARSDRADARRAGQGRFGPR
jgi:hypothetical protein